MSITLTNQIVEQFAQNYDIYLNSIRDFIMSLPPRGIRAIVHLFMHFPGTEGNCFTPLPHNHVTFTYLDGRSIKFCILNMIPRHIFRRSEILDRLAFSGFRMQDSQRLMNNLHNSYPSERVTLYKNSIDTLIDSAKNMEL